LTRLLVVALPGLQVMMRAAGNKAWLDDALGVILSNLD
jgi:TetR/AcrR family transcriptional repressor of nem operon